MKRIILCSIISFIILISTIGSAHFCVRSSPADIVLTTKNQEIFVGSASIIGDGTYSILTAIAEKNIFIRPGSLPAKLDFYIEYDIKCEGMTDEGFVTLTILKNGENFSFNAVQSPLSKNGSLYVENIEVDRGDTLGFKIDVLYASLIPLYSNATSDLGIGIVRKSKMVIKDHDESLAEIHSNKIHHLLWIVFALSSLLDHSG